jgi:Tfp pilus assembly protein PilX
MNKLHNSEPDANDRRRRKPSQGMALITTLLLLSVMMAMTMAMVIAATSDTLITKYYRNERTAFYAADSGVNIARAAMIGSLNSAAITAGTTFTSGTIPVLTSTDVSTALSTVSSYTSNTSILGGTAASSWPSSFTIVGTQSGTLGTQLASCVLGASTCTPSNITCSATATGATNAPSASPRAPYDCGSAWGGVNIPQCTGSCAGFSATVSYNFPYTITAIGQSIANEQQIVEDGGSLVVNATFDTAQAFQQSFAAYGMFINTYAECSGNDLVGGTISGPVFTNGAWTFGNSGSYTFTDKVGSHSSTFGWDNGGGNCTQSATYPQPGFSTTFQSTVSLGANSIPLPANDYDQKEAVVDGLGNAGGTTNALMNASLKTEGNTAYPSAGTTNPGVYLPFTNTVSSSCPVAPCMTGGGIYVEGNANSVVLSTGNAGGHTQQIFTITQGSGTTTTTTITVDLTAGTTTFASQVGSGTVASKTINGVPDNLTGASPSEAVMLYVDGNINSLSGPSSGAAIANGSAVTIDAGNGNNMTITGNITYANEPVTMTQNQIPGTPADTLIPANNSGQVLGLFTAGGQIQLNVPTNNQNLEIDASLASIVSGGSGGLVNTGNNINTLTIVGGRIQNTIENIGSNTRNVWFDRRFAQGGFAPPWFPSTTVTPTNTNSVTTVIPTIQRTQWLAAY